MKRLNLLLAVIWAMSLSFVISAQDRGVASSIAWSPDGDTIAVASTTGLWFFDNDFNEAGYFEIEQQTLILSLPRFVAWNANGDLIAYSGMHANPINIVDVSELKVITEIDEAYPWTPVRWHPIANRIVSGRLGGRTQIWDAITGEELFHFDSMAEHPDPLMHEPLGFCWFTDNILITVYQQRIFVLDVVEKMLVEKFGPAHFGSVNVDCNRENQILSVDGRLFDLEAASLTWISDHSFLHEDSEFHLEPVAVAWSPDSSQFIVNLTDCLVRVFDGRSGKVVAGMPGGADSFGPSPFFFIDSLAWHPDGSRFAAVGQFGDIRVWDAETYELLQRFDGFEVHPNVFAHLKKSGILISEVMCP